MGGGSELVLHRCESSFYFAQKERYILCILDGRAALPGFTCLACAFQGLQISTVSKVLSLLHSRFIFTMHSHSCSKSVWEPYLSELLLPSPNITHISSNGSCWKIKAFLSKFSSQTGTFCVTLCCLFFCPTPLGVIN